MNKYEEHLMYKIVWNYFMENRTQQEISEIFNISRAKIMKYLNEAKEQKIIQFKINSDISNLLTMEQKLMDIYNLKNVFITPSDTDNINETIAKAAAMYIQENMSIGDFINIGFGDTVSKVMGNISFDSNSNISLISLTGGVDYYLSSIENRSRIKPNLYIIPCPLLLSSVDLAFQLSKESSINEIFRMNQYANLTVLSIGAISENDTVVKERKITENEVKMLRNKGAVADILGYFIDENGNDVDDEFCKRLVSTHFTALKKMKNVIAVAGGEYKHKAIKAALKTRVIDILVTDEKTARYLIEN